MLAVYAGVAALLLAVPGLLRRRGVPGLVRATTVVALAVLFAGVVDVAMTVSQRSTPRLRVVATGPIDTAVLARLQARATASAAELTVRVAEAGVVAPELLSALRAAADPGLRVALVWAGPCADPEAVASLAPLRPAAGVGLFTAVEALAFDPRELRLRLPLEPEAGRPVGIELRHPRLAVAGGAVRVDTGDDEPLVLSVPGDERADAGPFRVELPFVPERAGRHRLEVGLRVTSGHEVHAAGVVTVGPPRPVLVVGAAAAAATALASLRVQGVAAEQSESLPMELDDVDVVVLTVPPEDAAAALRLAEFVDEGGGLMLVGGADGGGVPVTDEPLAAWSPVRLARRPAPDAARPGEGPGEQPLPERPPPEQAPPKAPPSDEPRPGAGHIDAAPPDPSAPEEEVERRQVAMVLVIDRSYSMNQHVSGGIDPFATRMSYVLASAKATANKLLPDDQLGVITFGNVGEHQVVLALTRAIELERTRAAIDSIRVANEGTNVTSALHQAGVMLGRSGAAVQHVVVITDGAIEQDWLAASMASELRRRGVTVSVIQLGPREEREPKRIAQRIAEAGGGRPLIHESAASVPALVSSEVRQVFRAGGRPDPNARPERSGADAARQQPAETDDPGRRTEPLPTGQDPPEPAPRTEPADGLAAEVLPTLAVRALAPNPLLEPVPRGGFPPLRGNLDVAAAADARVLLVAGSEGRPLLAYANRGLGRVAAWTAGLDGRWSERWRAATPFPAWWAQWVSALAPPIASAQPDSLLEQVTVTPAAPTPVETAAFAALAGGASLRPLAELDVPEPTSVRRLRGTARELALAALAALLALALVEFVRSRW